MKFVILSDIHANVTALEAVFQYIETKYKEHIKFLILGDFINYGPRPNEAIAILKQLGAFSIILGNHENAYLTKEVSRFSSQRGVDSLKHTISLLNADSKEFISKHNRGTCDIVIDNRRILLVHGDLSDIYWGKMKKEEMEREIYASYDFVLSGHTHIPHYHEYFYPVNQPSLRNLKKTIFINSGSVGQPRNHNNQSQFCVLDFSTEWICFEKVDYDIKREVTFFSDKVDSFYKERLLLGV